MHRKKRCVAWARKPRKNFNLKSKRSSERGPSLRQLLHWTAILVGAAEGCDLLIFNKKPRLTQSGGAFALLRDA
ncbi:hypothetical protein EMIT0215P_20130 [Pseudomonas serboccidentalis]